MSTSLSTDELHTLIKLAKRILWARPEIRQQLQQEKVNIIPANYYSEIPSVDEINGSFEYRHPHPEVYNRGIFVRDRIRAFLEELSKYSKEFSPSVNPDPYNPNRFFWRNPAFSYADAMAYYCVIRHLKPQHILEIGSGFSTLIANEALERNGAGRLTLIEPYPKPFLSELPRVESIIKKGVQELPVDELVGLVESADVWFIDSTHTVKIGSDCLYLYLLVMPALSKDVMVHSHDIHLPYGMPRKAALDKHIYWTEQYLLYAYMLDNDRVEVLYGSAYARAALSEELDRFMAGKYRAGGASLWYRLRAAKK